MGRAHHPLERRARFARTVSEYRSTTLAQDVRAMARDVAIFALSLGQSIGRSRGWIRFPYYHHVFDDERRGFERQLRYLRNFGDFVGIDQAVDWWERGESIDGRFFCVTFDDGMRNQFTNALPILVAQDVPACFFIPSGFVGHNTADAPELKQRLSRAALGPVEFVTWDDCRAMIAEGMAIGSHTDGHRRLSDLTAEQSRAELRASRCTLERELAAPVAHFAAPWGVPDVDYLEARDVALAMEEGYRSFLTTRRGPNVGPSSRLGVRRDLLSAKSGLHHLRHFLART